MVTALQTMVTRRFDVFDPVVITVGSFHAGTTDNVIPDDAWFPATIRSFSAATRARVKDARRSGWSATSPRRTAWPPTTEYCDGYPVTVNDPAEAAFAEHAAAALFGRERFAPLPHPVTGAEDFSFVLERVPGAFLFLGACPPDLVPADGPAQPLGRGRLRRRGAQRRHRALRRARAAQAGRRLSRAGGQHQVQGEVVTGEPHFPWLPRPAPRGAQAGFRPAST